MTATGAATVPRIAVRPRSPVLRRLVEATNAHDLDALVACFTADVRNETPAHPSRGFAGSEQIRRNWGAIFDAVPDIQTSVLAEADDGNRVWCEFAFDGTRRDGMPHHMRGVVIFGVQGDQFDSVSFFMEPVIDDGLDQNEALTRALSFRPAGMETAGSEAAR